MNSKQSLRNLSDAELVKSVSEECGEAFDILMERHSSFVIAFLSNYLNDAAAADAAQDVWLKVLMFLRHQRYNEEQHFPNWLITIAKNHALNCLREQKNEHLVHNESLLNRVAVLPPYLLPASGRRKALLRALKKLKGKKRTIVFLHFFKHMTLADIAKKFGVEVGTITSTYSKALKLLRKEPGLHL